MGVAVVVAAAGVAAADEGGAPSSELVEGRFMEAIWPIVGCIVATLALIFVARRAQVQRI